MKNPQNQPLLQCFFVPSQCFVGYVIPRHSYLPFLCVPEDGLDFTPATYYVMSMDDMISVVF
uniref:Uncharacterized protein n=1 Tax=Arundo donax TaxID=35708 RepID=A0A0A9HKC3_ARUDO